MYLLLVCFASLLFAVSARADVITDVNKKACSDLEERVRLLEAQVTRLAENEDRLLALIENIEDKNGNSRSLARRQMPYSAVAFSAGVTVFDLTNLGNHHTIVFDRVLSNYGNGYNEKTGIFIAPVKGVYFFTVTLQVIAHHLEYLELAVDGQQITDIYAAASSSNDNMSTSKTWILGVEQGSSVWVRTTDYYNQGEIHGNMHTMFSGFLIAEEE